jgi:DNA primase
VYIAYDGDAAGQNATIRGLDILTAEGLNVRVIVFPNGQDPDEFARKSGKEGFDRLKDEALTLNAFKLEAMARNYSMEKENEREQYAMEACRFIATLTPVERERHYQMLSKKTGYQLETLRAQGASARPLERQQPVSASRERTGTYKRSENAIETERTRAENALIFHMLQSREAASLAGEQGLERLFLGDGLRVFAEAVIRAYARGEEPNLPLILSGMEKQDAERVSAALREEAACEEPEKAAKDCLCRIERCDLSEEIETIKRQLNDSALPAGERAELLRNMQTLNLRMRALS